MQRAAEVAREPLAQRRRRVEPDVDVHVPKGAALEFEHAMRREVAQAPAQPAECLAERRGDEVDGDVALGLHAEQRCEPSGRDGMTRQPAKRVSADDDVTEGRVLRVLKPCDIGVVVKTVSNDLEERVAGEPLSGDAERREAIARAGACGVQRRRRLQREGRRGRDVRGVCRR